MLTKLMMRSNPVIKRTLQIRPRNVPDNRLAAVLQYTHQLALSVPVLSVAL